MKAALPEIWILAGGKSSRMGKDKARIQVHGKSFLGHLLHTIQPLLCPIRVVAPHPFSETDSVFPDLIPDQGPLGGLFTALSHLKSTGLVLLSCDMPFLPMHRVEPFLAYQGPGPLVPVFQGRRHPFPAWFPASCLPEVRLRIERGQLRMEDFLASQSCTELFWETDFQNHPEWFAHFNKPEDLHHYLAKWNPHT